MARARTRHRVAWRPANRSRQTRRSSVRKRPSTHERAAFVEVLAGLHDILHAGLREPLVTALQQVYEQAADAEAAADLLLVIFEGAHAHAYADPKEGVVETAIGLLATTP